VVLGFPSQDFNQELATDLEVKEFACGKYDAKWKLMQRAHVKWNPSQNAAAPGNSKVHPVFAFLQNWAGPPAYPSGAPTDKVVSWNFHKFVVGRDGRPAGVFSRREPIEPTVKAELAKKAPESKI